MPSVLEAAGPQAARIAELWWLMLLVCGAVFAAVLAVLLYALWRSRRATPATPPDLTVLSRRERGARIAVVAATALSAALLVVLLVASVLTDRALGALAEEDSLDIQVTANQWWWHVRYDDPVPARTFEGANEIHVPVGRVVSLKLRSNDVIHSFWVPNLHGKQDAIPGRETTIKFRADKPGIYRGECAEYCGVQHAKMQFIVVAQAPEDFDAWARAQRRPAPEPKDEFTRRGRDVFVKGRCATCHSIVGADAFGRMGPDLTHVASRKTLAAGILPNTRGHLAGWIVDPQSIKPGARMPPNPLPPHDLAALLAYLATLE